jgi:hypothetical protein
MQFQCRQRLFAEIRRMQLAYPDTSFAACLIDDENPEHQKLVSLILKKLGAYDQDYVTGYLVWVTSNFKGLGGSAQMRKARPPGQAGGPETLGLLVSWAEDYDHACCAQRTRASGGGA